MMKRLSILLIISILIGACIGCSINHNTGDLTPKQKEKDFQYLTDLITKAYPFTDANVKIKGLTELSTLSDDYISRAKNTKNNTEFMELFNEYLVRLSQTGHAYLIKPIHFDYLNTISQDYKQYYNSYSDLNKAVNEKVVFWSNIDDTSPKPVFVQPEVSIAYDDGKYSITEDSRLKTSGVTIPKGSIVEEIDGKSADDYIKSLQSRVHLNFDHNQNKLYLKNPLIILPDENSNNWNVRFKLPDGSNANEVVGIGTSCNGTNNLDSVYPNVVTVELSENAGYIKIFGMGIGTGDILKDKEAITNFIRQSQGKYKKLLIDIRGNMGGDPAYWMDFLVAPLIKEPIEYTQTAAVKNDFIQRWGTNLQRYISAKQGLLTKRLHFSAVKEVLNSSYFDKSWRVFEVTREIKPKDSLPFSGEIFLFTDENSFSASEDFALFCKQTSFAKIVGIRTGGGAAVFLLSHIFALPESKLLFCIEMEAALNPDGTINELIGTVPDISMDPQPSPVSYKREALLDDKWIQRIMSEP